MKLIKSKKIRIAIVGCGRISKNHFDSINSHTEDIQLVSICDNNQTVLSKNEKLKSLEKNTVLTSLENLTTFPFIKEAINNETLSLHGLWHDIGTGDLMFYDNKSSKFILV